MFLGPTNLVLGDYYTGENVGTINRITRDGATWVFVMYSGDVYKTDAITELDVLVGGGDRIFIPANAEKMAGRC